LCVIGIIQNLIVLWGISPSWTQGVSGMVLIAAVTVTWLTKGRGGGRTPSIS
jgi:ribose/xylose/arabinose/galactoside ABC-type transport system permease subunit